MTHLVNEVQDFTVQATAGLTRLHAKHVVPTPGGVVKVPPENGAGDPARVKVVIGGGSGHYPAFTGWVGPGLADAAVIGNTFASPSTAQIYDVAQATGPDQGVLLGYGNYAGDVLNFNAAQDRLRAQGIEVLSIAVTDDLASAPVTARATRRGVAGDLIVFKCTSAAAEQGLSLPQVHAVASRANERTSSLGIAFSGCTLPGADTALFEVPHGKMAIGMGVHGEPGLRETDLLASHQIARILVDPILAERPTDSGDRIAVLLNGLGATKYEELLVLWNDVSTLLLDHGLTLVAPQVGEIMTSLDMAGVSLTVSWLDPELEDLWTAPCDSIALVMSAAPVVLTADAHNPGPGAKITDLAPQKAAPHNITGLIAAASRVVTALKENEQLLGELDAVAGDGDHGRGMVFGATAALQQLQAITGPITVEHAIIQAADAWAAQAGGTSGALWGTLLRTTGTALSQTSQTSWPLAVAFAVQQAVDEIGVVGGAVLGDKTMLDAAIPFAHKLLSQVAQTGELSQSWLAAVEVADTCAQGTANIVSRMGRSRIHGDKSLGHPDPGAVSFVLVAQAMKAHNNADLK